MLRNRRLILNVVLSMTVLLSTSSWAQPDLQLGSATGMQGETVTIPVNFTNNGSVVGLQFDVQFNTTQLTVGTSAGGAALSPHLLHWSTPSAGTLRVLIRPDITPSLPNVGNGEVVSVPFTIKAGAVPGTYDLTLPPAGVVFSDGSANAVSAGTLTKGQVTVGRPDISISPLVLDFGTVKVGTSSATKSVTVSNLSSATANLTVTKVEITGANSSDFSQTTNCSAPLTPGSSCVANVAFTPSSSDPKGAALSIQSNDPDQGVVTVALNGTGGVPHILARRVLLSEDFTSGIPTTWTNVDAWSTGCGRVIGSPFIAPWAIVDPSCGPVSEELLYTPVFDAGSCTELALLISNRFSHGTGTRGTISITDNYGKDWTEALTMSADEGPGWKEIDLGGAVGAEGAQIEFAYSTSSGFWAIDNVWVLCRPADLTFKALTGATSDPQTILITNTGTVDLNLSSVTFTGTDGAQFGVIGGGCTGKVGPSESCPVRVAFSPTSTGLKDDAKLHILSDASDSPTLEVPLSGKGVVLLASPEQGTLGSQITIHGSGFGDKKGKAMVGGAALKVLTWTSNSIEGLVSKVLTLGPSTVAVQTKQKGASPITQDDAFSVETPQIWTIVPDHGGVNTPVVITGKYFGAKKGKVTIGGKSCKVTSWAMDASTGMSTIQFLVPKGLAAQPYDLKVISKVGEGVDRFTIVQ